MDLVATLLNVIKVALIGMFVLTVLVFVHELGHFWVAKLCGMKVDAFAVMMGGVRKTKLDSYLAKPLAPALYPWLAGLAASMMILVGVVMNNQAVFLTGLGLAAVPIPLWVVTRLQALYQLNRNQGVVTMVKAWVGALIILAVATRFQGVTAQLVFSLLLAGSLVGMMIVYYIPVSNKAEDTKMGEGRLTLAAPNDVPKEVPVRFRPVASVQRGETEFSLLLLPLGGFAAITGMHPKDDGSEVNVPFGFYSKTPFKRLLTLFAGPFFSIAFGIIVLTSVTLIQGVHDYSTTTVSKVSENSAAGVAGIKVGDEIVAVNGKKVSRLTEMSKVIRYSYNKQFFFNVPKPVLVNVVRKGEPMQFVVLPDIDEEPTPVLDDKGEPTEEKAFQARLGVNGTPVMKKAGFGEALADAALKPVELVQSLASIVVKPANAKESIGGPKALADATSTASNEGFFTVLRLAALLSISLGVMNLLPIPPLDGGQMVVAFIEMLRGGKRLSLNVQQTVSNVGAMLVVLLMISAITLDVGRTAANAKEAKKPTPQKGQIKSPTPVEK